MMENKQEKINVVDKQVLPSDWTREIPARYWQWLLQYGLPMSYWKPYCGFTETEGGRLIITYGNPVEYSVGRSLEKDIPKWRSYGDKTKYVECLGPSLGDSVVLVEDLVSAHKVAQVTACIPLFGTNIHDHIVRELKVLMKPVVIWLDNDQYANLPKKVHRLQTLLNLPVSYLRTDKDPKAYSVDQIAMKEYLK
jgi:hypothetical protein